MIKIKPYIRDYAISSFIFYALNNKSVDDYKDKLYLNTIDEFKSMNIPFSLSFYENKLRSHESEINDLYSVHNTVNKLQNMCRYDILSCLDIVYFSIKSEQISKRLISCNVTKASIELFISERTVYNYLNKAINIFALDRGLRV